MIKYEVSFDLLHGIENKISNWNLQSQSNMINLYIYPERSFPTLPKVITDPLNWREATEFYWCTLLRTQLKRLVGAICGKNKFLGAPETNIFRAGIWNVILCILTDKNVDPGIAEEQLCPLTQSAVKSGGRSPQNLFLNTQAGKLGAFSENWVRVIFLSEKFT